MKNLKYLFGSILVITALFLSGCYTQVAMTDNGSNNSGYGYNNNSQGYYQTPADSNYGDQYGYQNYQDSTQQGTANNYYYNNPPYYNNSPYYSPWSSWNSYYWNPSFSLGFYWGSPFYDPNYWDPFGLWSYNYPGYYPYYNSFYPSYYPYYYGYNGYYSGLYGGYSTIIPRTHDTYQLRNNDGFRNSGDRGSLTRTNGSILVSSPSSYGGRSEPYGRTMNKPSSTGNAPAAVSGRSNNGRQMSGRAYNGRSGNARNNNGYYNGARVQNRNNNSRPEPRTYTPPRRTYSPPARTYSPPPRSYSPPPRTYSPPAHSYSPPSYSAPRSYSPPARSEGGSRGSSSGGGRRGR